ncbi:sulfite reductase, dissimilatory-type beta subunit, partial [bacterium]|nr:sulfite reductase, dissimilatory-type beta subunit [bacterium]
MADRITDIGPPHFEQFLPPVIKENYGKWVYHEQLRKGVLKHVAEGGGAVYTVRAGGSRLMSIQKIRQICDLADKH